MSTATTIVEILSVAAPTILAIVTHEVAHGWAAERLGDDTARRAGRLSLNPLRHIDPLGTIILPALLYVSSGFTFGWAKPVPVDFRRLRRPKADMAWVAAAGPVVNVLLAVLSGAAFAFVPPRALLAICGGVDFSLVVRHEGMVTAAAATFLVYSVVINTALTVLNLIPVPPLDGGRIAVGLLPRGPALALARTERFGMFALMGILVILPLVGNQLGYPVDALGWLIEPAVNGVLRFFAELNGLGG